MNTLRIPTVTLNNGLVMPQIGFGTAHLSDDQAREALADAFAAGYRKVDTATAYTNERGVGAAIAASGLPRASLFVTTKVWNSDQGRVTTRPAFEASLERLGLDYVDCYLIHWPAPALGRFTETWEVLEELYTDGLARAIGLSNFRAEDIAAILAASATPPALNQIELHPYHQRRELRARHAELGIATEAWAPLGQGTVLGDPVLAGIAARQGITPAQAVLRWHLQRGHVIIPRSASSGRLRANLAVADLPPLPDSDLAAIDALDQKEGLGLDPATFN